MSLLTEKTTEFFIVTVLRYAVIAGVPFFIFYKLFFKKFTANKIQQKKAEKKHFFREVSYSLATSLIFSFVSAVLLFTPIVEYTQVYYDIDAYPAWWIPASVVLSLVIHDTYFYWMHRTLHHKKLFKLTHLVHHKSTNPSPLASYSFHFLESFAEVGILVLLVFIMPLHPLGIIGFIVSGFIINVYGHLGFEIMPRKFRHSVLFEIFNTSVHHNLHHSKFKGNYGLYFRHWDRICGTEHPDYVKEYDRVQQRRFGKENIEVQVIEEESYTLS